jgi:hypothetical protein
MSVLTRPRTATTTLGGAQLRRTGGQLGHGPGAFPVVLSDKGRATERNRYEDRLWRTCAVGQAARSRAPQVRVHKGIRLRRAPPAPGWWHHSHRPRTSRADRHRSRQRPPGRRGPYVVAAPATARSPGVCRWRRDGARDPVSFPPIRPRTASAGEIQRATLRLQDRTTDGTQAGRGRFAEGVGFEPTRTGIPP